MSLELIAVTVLRTFLIARFKTLPLWAKLLVITATALLTILLLGIVLAVIWITYSFISSGVWKTLPPQVAASIVAGLFAVITLFLGNSITKEREIKSTLRLKEIESQEARLTKKTEFYVELIDKLIALTQNCDQVDELLKNFYGKLYIQASPQVTENFLQILNLIKTNENDQQILKDDIKPEVDNLIKQIKEESMEDKRKVALLYNPSIFNQK